MASIDDYAKIDKLGEGSYGVVYKCKTKLTGEIVALKKIYDCGDEGVPPTALREVSLLKEISGHPNIVKLLDVILENDSSMYLVFSFYPNDLNKYLDNLPKGTFLDIEKVKSFMFQIISGVLYCHRRRILHRDLKPGNILVDEKGIIKIADFGLARTFDIPIRRYTCDILTLWYRPPELLLGAKIYACPIDIWGIGCIMAELVTKKALFPGDSEIDQLYRIFRILTTPTEETWPGVTELPDYQAGFPQWGKNTLEQNVGYLADDTEGLDLLKKLLIYNPAKRISAKAAVEHPFLQDVDKSYL